VAIKDSITPINVTASWCLMVSCEEKKEKKKNNGGKKSEARKSLIGGFLSEIRENPLWIFVKEEKTNKQQHRPVFIRV